MAVRFVELPQNLIGSIQLPGLGSLMGMFKPVYIAEAAGVAFIASAETLLSASAVDKMHDGPRANYDKELMSQGVGNTLSGLLGGLPMTGVIVRSATNVAAGAKTRRSAMLHGIWLLILVAVFPQVLRLVPTSSLAAILVYTGYKLVNPANLRRLSSYGAAPTLIYLATITVIVCVDLLAGILTGIGLSVAKVLWALTQMDIEVKKTATNRVDVHISGAATFFRLPKLVDTLEALPADSDVYIHLHDMQYIDHACLDAITNCERSLQHKNSKVFLEWDELRRRYRDRNHFGPLHPGDLELARASASAH
jgi:MFS superfamily sulfate permease-like transporter